MKSILKVSLLAATVLAAVGCQKEETKAPEQAATQVEATKAEATKADATAATEFKTEDDKAAYAMGVSFAQYLTQNMDKQEELGVSLSKDIILTGIQDAFAEKSQLSDEEIQTTLASLGDRVNKKLEEQQKVAAEKAAKDAAEAKSKGDEFRANFEKEDGVTKTDSGLLYKVITPAKDADAKSPKETDTVVVHYKGTLIDGTQFDSSYERNQPASFPLNQVITGWTEGLQLMKVGEKAELVLPPELAYGEHPTASIPGNSTLVFEVELLDIKDAEQVKKEQAEAAKNQPSQAQIQAAMEAEQKQMKAAQEQ